MSKYNDEFVKLLVEESENMSVNQIASKYNLTRGQVIYVIYNLGWEERNKDNSKTSKVEVKMDWKKRLLKLLTGQ
jgi:hypothetical protein